MKVFITGATGFIGENLSNHLVKEGFWVNALFRSIEKTKNLNHKNINLFKGDILDKDSLRKAMAGCNQVYHIAAFTDVWTKTPEIIYELNVIGTKNVFDTALELGITDLVFTSTAGVLGPSLNKKPVNERGQRIKSFFLEYERTKALAEELAHKYVLKGLNIRIVNPTRVYGPGILSKSNSVTQMMVSYNKGRWHIIPGNGKSIGNYVFINDVVKGHVLAMEKGIAGEKYILGGENLDYLNFFKTIKDVSGKTTWMIQLPVWAMLIFAEFNMIFARIFGLKPFITPALVKKFNHNWIISSNRAIKALGYNITSFKKGVELTLNWINSNNI